MGSSFGVEGEERMTAVELRKELEDYNLGRNFAVHKVAVAAAVVLDNLVAGLHNCCLQEHTDLN